MFDLLTLAALHDEISNRLVGGRVQRVLQVGPAAIGLEVYARHERLTLVVDVERQDPWVSISREHPTADPSIVTPLLLLLRKYARGGVITATRQPAWERIIQLEISKRFWPDKLEDEDVVDDLPVEPETTVVHLIFELMGRRSNAILTRQDGRILDVARRVTPSMSRARPLLPGRQYEAPPAQAKAHPDTFGPGSCASMLAGVSPDTPVANLLIQALAGFSPQMAAEAVYRTIGSDVPLLSGELLAHGPDAAERLSQAVRDVVFGIASHEWQPSVYTEPVSGEPKAFSAIPLGHLSRLEREQFEWMSQAIERYRGLSQSSAPVRHAQRREHLLAEINQARDRLRARLHSLEEQAQRAKETESWREAGEAIYANLYRINPGQSELEVDGQTIALDPTLSPSANAQHYFERYRKGQAATGHLPGLEEAARAELDYLDQLATFTGFSQGIDEVEQLRQEWESYQHAHGSGRQSDRGKPRNRAGAPARTRPYRGPSGTLIYVGHNGRQNDEVTFDIAGQDDLWLHARGVPGAHVILRGADRDAEDVVERAAAVAAYFSSARSSTSVEVDVTERRHVRKIKGAGPGMVTYRQEQTLSVHPASPEEVGFELPDASRRGRTQRS
ncbi:MAG TPA: NFACT family protein [Thermomicrobiaceae bacterium]|nr:NFACT family protein [Thermomicrobiaceae bacterium]